MIAAITAPGVYDMPEDAYHADPVPGGSLSSSGARRLLPPSCPALFAYEREHPRASAAFEYGTAAHLLVLGEGPKIVVVDAEEWRTKAIKEEVAAIRAAGNVPLKPSEHEQVQQMAAALRRHPIAGRLFQPGTGDAERSLFWIDQRTGVWRRARPDWMPHRSGGRLVVADYKTCRSAAPDNLQRAIHEYGYHQQAAWYLDGVRALGLDDAPAFVLVAQEKTPPYLVTVAQVDVVALRIGRELNARALEIYRDCTAAGVWPGYSDDVELIGLPGWVEARHREETW